MTFTCKDIIFFARKLTWYFVDVYMIKERSVFPKACSMHISFLTASLALQTRMNVQQETTYASRCAVIPMEATTANAIKATELAPTGSLVKVSDN